MSTRSKRSRGPSGKAVENVSISPAKKPKAKKKKSSKSVVQPTAISNDSTSQDTIDSTSQNTIDVGLEERIVFQVTEKLVPVLTEKLKANLTATSPEMDVEEDGDSSEDDEEVLRTSALSTMIDIDKGTDYQRQADFLPAVKPTVLSKIRDGKFVDFGLLLPDIELNEHCELDIVQSASGKNKLRVGKSQSANKIISFTQWIYAWNSYLRIMVVYHPHLTKQLVFYQSTITDMYTRYTIRSVLLYDTQFRMKIANKSIFRWDFYDLSLRSSHLIPLQKPMSLTQNSIEQDNGGKKVCFACKQHGHNQNSPTCPLFTQSNLQYIVDQRVAQTPHTAETQTNSMNRPFLAPQPGNANTRPNIPRRSAQIPSRNSQPRRLAGHCSFWNRGTCIKTNCTYVHACEMCGETDHTRQHCPHR